MAQDRRPVPNLRPEYNKRAIVPGKVKSFFWSTSAGHLLDGFIDIVKALRTLLKAAWSINPIHIEKFLRINFGNARNQTWGCWVRSKNATSVLCSPPPYKLILVSKKSHYSRVQPNLLYFKWKNK